MSKIIVLQWNEYVHSQLINELKDDFMETSWESGYGLSFQYKILKLSFCVCMEILEERIVLFLLDYNSNIVCMLVLKQNESL